MNGLLHLEIEILYAQAQSIEAETPQSFEMPHAGDARIDFDAYFGVRSKRKSFGREPEEVLHLRGREIGGRAAAPVELHHRARAIDVRGHTFNFALERR